MLRVVAMVLFGLMFLAEAGDLYGLVLTLADPAPAADRFGITASAGSTTTGVFRVANQRPSLASAGISAIVRATDVSRMVVRSRVISP